jgi:putative hemolysin
MKKITIILLVLLGLVVVVLGFGIYKFNFTNDDIKTAGGNIDNSKQNNASVGLANPASVNCSKVGGNLVMEKRGDLGEYGLCYFADNKACEEWALFRGDCPLGGVKTTGFDTVDQKYCAWSGGQTLAVPNSVCTLKNGSKCSTLDFYNGKCPVNN